MSKRGAQIPRRLLQFLLGLIFVSELSKSERMGVGYGVRAMATAMAMAIAMAMGTGAVHVQACGYAHAF